MPRAGPSDIGSASPANSLTRLGHFSVLYGAAVLAAGYAQLLATIPGTGISIWLPSGLLMGALLVSPRSSWLWWIAAAAAAELTGNILWFGNTLPVAALILCGNILEAVVGAFLIGRLIAWPFELRSIRDVLGLVALGAILSPVIAATIGGITLMVSEGQPFERAFTLLWIGDATGILVAAPAAITVAHSWQRRRWTPSRRLLEVAAFAVAIVGVALASLSGRLPFGLIFLPLILLASARFYFWGSTLTTLGLTLLIAAFELLDVDPFLLAGSGLEANVQEQLFLSIAAFSTLIVAALAKQNAESMQRLVDSNRELERRVLERTASLSASESRLRRVMETAQVGIAFANDQGHLTGGNAALADLLGRAREELGTAELDWTSLISPSAQSRFTDEMVRLETTHTVGPFDLLLLKADGTPVPAIFAASELGNGELVAFIVDQTQQKRHEAHIELLMGEVTHRAKNILAVVQSVARQTKAATVPEFLSRFDDRLRSLSLLQNLLVANDWKGAPLESIIREQLTPYGDAVGTRITVGGPQISLSSSAAQTIALAVHELATNAAKYGALSNDAGTVDIKWETMPGNKLALTWVESNGPPVAKPSHRGFGTVVVEAMIKGIEGCAAQAEYHAGGLRWSFHGPLQSLVAPE